MLWLIFFVRLAQRAQSCGALAASLLSSELPHAAVRLRTSASQLHAQP